MLYTKQLTKMMSACCIILLSIVVASCTKRGDNLKLNPIPTPAFDIVNGSNGNNFILVNKTPGASIPNWRVSTGQSFSGDSARLKLIFKGTYEIKLIVVTQGGLDSVTKTVTVAASDPTACDPSNAIGFIASCTQKKWKLNPEAGTYKVGEGAGNGNWWSSGMDAVTGRACEFNDEYIFSFDAEGTFVYDNKGDFFADNNLGPQDGGCHPNSAFKPVQMPWASGNFTFSVVEGTGVRGLGQLKVNGLGAHIGLQKAYNGGEIGVGLGPTATSITYDILEMRKNPGGATYDILVIGLNIGGAGWWTFTLRSY